MELLMLMDMEELEEAAAELEEMLIPQMASLLMLILPQYMEDHLHTHTAAMGLVRNRGVLAATVAFVLFTPEQLVYSHQLM
jgi:hypothetical protein